MENGFVIFLRESEVSAYLLAEIRKSFIMCLNWRRIIKIENYTTLKNMNELLAAKKAKIILIHPNI